MTRVNYSTLFGSAVLAVLLASCGTPNFVHVREEGKAPYRVSDKRNLIPPHIKTQFYLDAADVVGVSFQFKGEEYHIFSGDQLRITFNNNSKFDIETTVRPDGRITLPNMGEITAAGKSPRILTRELTDLYASKLKKPNITINVDQANSQPMREASGDYVIRPDGHLVIPQLGEIKAKGLTALELSQTLSERATKRFKNSLDASVVVKTTSQSIYVMGEVGKPDTFPLQGSLTLSQALALAGGITESGDRNRIVLIHYQPNGDVVVYKTSFDNIVERASGLSDITLSRGDVIYVPRTKIADANLFIEQYVNKMVPFTRNVSYTYTNVFQEGM